MNATLYSSERDAISPILLLSRENARLYQICWGMGSGKFGFDFRFAFATALRLAFNLLDLLV
jgi:hypothetical protein